MAAAANLAWMEAERAQVEARLEAALPGEGEAPETLHRAMRHSLLGGGKRLRPLLCRAAALAVAGEPVEAAWAPACGLEMIHTYSLIHDDLPALDNDALRRGQPTCHVVFGEAIAILAGDALLTLGLEQLAAAGARAGAMLKVLAAAAGTPAGMVAGQVADLEAEGVAVGLEEVRWIHARKTAALIRAAVVLGGMAAGASREQGEALSQYGQQIGLAFQIVDDLLDLSGFDGELGKTPGKDVAQAKATYPALAGRDAAAAEASRLRQQACDELVGFGPAAGHLLQLSAAMVDRQR